VHLRPVSATANTGGSSSVSGIVWIGIIVVAVVIIGAVLVLRRRNEEEPA